MLLGTQDKEFFPEDIVEKFCFVKEMGFEAFEIDGKMLVDHLSQVQEGITKSGIPVVSACGGYRGWIGDFIEEKRKNGVADLKEIIRALQAVGGKGVVIPAAWGMFTFRLPPMVSPRSHEGDVEAILTSLEELIPVAEECGIYLYLEPLNRYQDHMLNTMKDGVNIIKACGSPVVKLTGDFYHMSIEEDDISESLRMYASYYGHIHIAENHRYQPGTGSIDFKRHMDTLREIGYTGAVVNEGRVRGKDPLKAYQESVVYMKQFM